MDETERDKRWMMLLMLTWASVGLSFRQVNRLLAETHWITKEQRAELVNEYRRRVGS